MPQQGMWIWDDTNKEWVKLAGTAGGAMSIHAIVEKLSDVEDVDVTGLADTYILYWDDASSTWMVQAMPAGTWAALAGKPDAPSLEELATEHEADGTHGDITPTGCDLRYDDAEAVTAMGVLGDANPLHHDKYTDVKAVAAAKTVKLDDFTAPEDNTDLDAVAAKHGLMPKLDKVKLATVDADADVTGANPPQAHAALHEDTGADEISIAGLAGESVELAAHKADPDAHHTDLASITFIIDGGGSAITTGIKGHLRIPFACGISRVTMLADQSGSIVVDIWKDTYANFPPDNGDTITSITPPTITTAVKSEDSTLTDWTTAIAADDILAFNVDSVTDIERVTISLKVTKS